MSIEQIDASSDMINDQPKCPIDHHSLPRRKASRPAELTDLPIECDVDGVWQVRGFEEARFILRSNHTRQAGFNAEMITQIQGMQNTPILYQEGKVHHQQRKQTARFFTPKTVSSDYRRFMEALADQLVEDFRQRKQVDLSQLSLRMAVAVASRVVGLTNSRLQGMDKRLEAFFHDSAQQDTKPSTPHKWKLLNIVQTLFSQRLMLAFYFLDVQPAIRARKRVAQEDVISHLLGLKYSDPEILTECVTYAAAGMVTTREFISIAAWHMLEHPELRQRYLTASEEERIEILHETLRLEPIVGNLYRRATARIELDSQGQHFVIPEGALVNIHINATNTDERVVGEEPEVLCPGRQLREEHVPSMLMGFGDGAHRCPGSFLAIQETDIFLQRLLSLDGLKIKSQPSIAWNELVTGYEVRNFMVMLEK